MSIIDDIVKAGGKAIATSAILRRKPGESAIGAAVKALRRTFNTYNGKDIDYEVLRNVARRSIRSVEAAERNRNTPPDEYRDTGPTGKSPFTTPDKSRYVYTVYVEIDCGDGGTPSRGPVLVYTDRRISEETAVSAAYELMMAGVTNYTPYQGSGGRRGCEMTYGKVGTIERT